MLGMMFLVPLIWLLGVLADLHRGALAASSAAREAGFEAARGETLADAHEAARVTTATAFVDHGIDPSLAKVDVSAGRLERGATVEVRVSYAVTVLQAPLLGRVAGPSIWVRAGHVALVDPYRSRP